MQLLLAGFNNIFATSGAGSELQCGALQHLGNLTANNLFYQTMEILRKQSCILRSS